MGYRKGSKFFAERAAGNGAYLKGKGGMNGDLASDWTD